jgi:eukaryotic-like serine/threonine-protein kinase
VVVAVIVGIGAGTATVLLGHHGSQAAAGGSGAAQQQPAAQSSSQQGSSPPSSSPPGSSPGTGTEQAQLARVTTQIRRSVSARSTVVTATQGVAACTMAPSKGISLMNQAISERRAVITRLGTLPVTTVRGGQQLLADFKQVLQRSIRADQGFIGWMQDVKNSGTCTVNATTDASYQTGLQASLQANSAKGSFLDRWNPLASRFGQPRYTASQI